MQTLTLVEILWTLLLVVSNGLAAVLWNKIKRLESDAIRLESELYSIKFNYLGRFDEVRTQISSLQLTLTERISKLEPQINQLMNMITEIHEKHKKE